MQHDGKIENFTLRGTLFIKKESIRKQLLQNNHKNWSQSKDFNKNTDISNTATPQDTFYRKKPKVNSVRFEDPYDHINPTENTHENTHIIDTQEQNI